MKKKLDKVDNFYFYAIIFLYFSVEKYEEFSLQKSISACVIAKSKLMKKTEPEEARKICEKEIRKNR